MGMFDYVQHECVCPVCRSKVANFQSKDGPCKLLTLQPSEVECFYSTCPKCGCWVQFDAIEVPKENFTMVASALKGNKLPGRVEVAREDVYISPRQIRLPPSGATGEQSMSKEGVE